MNTSPQRADWSSLPLVLTPGEVAGLLRLHDSRSRMLRGLERQGLRVIPVGGGRLRVLRDELLRWMESGRE